LRLVARGDLELDQDVNAILKRWKLTAGDSWEPRVSVRQLLSHRAGTSVGGFPGYPRTQPAPPLLDVLDGTGGANTPPVRVRLPPGLQYSYSGGGYCVLQQALIDRTGSAFDELARDLLFDPLGLRDTGYEQDWPDRPTAETAEGHRVDATPLNGGSFVYPEMAPAGLWTTPSDLARILLSVQQAARSEPDTLLPPELARDMITDPSGSGYGLGFRTWDHQGGRMFGHGGDTQGFLCIALAHAELPIGAVVMTNGDNAQCVIPAVLDYIGEREGWPQYTHVNSASAELPLAGTYRLPDGSTVAVEVHDRRVALLLPGQSPLPMNGCPAGAWASDAVDIWIKTLNGVGREDASLRIAPSWLDQPPPGIIAVRVSPDGRAS
jgi:hypothetical protein